MKLEITVSKNELLSKLKAVSKVINPSNKVIPAHGFFLFELSEEFNVTGADESGNITATIECMGCNEETTIKLLVESKTLLEGLKELPEQPLNLVFESTGNRFDFTVFHQSGKYKIQSMDADGFSVIKNDVLPKLVNILSVDLMHGIKSVYQFAGTDDLRPIMSTVHIQSNKGKYSFCAATGATLSLIEFMKDPTPNEFADFELVLPIKVAKILTEISVKAGMVSLEIGEKNVGINFGEFRIIYRLVEGSYPNFRSVIPLGNDKKLIVNTSDMISALRRTSVFANKASSLVMLNASKSNLKLTCKDVDYDQLADENLPVTFNEDNFTIGFATSHLLKCLESINTEELKMTFSDPTRACLISPDDVNLGLLILIMPLQINV